MRASADSSQPSRHVNSSPILKRRPTGCWVPDNLKKRKYVSLNEFVVNLYVVSRQIWPLRSEKIWQHVNELGSAAARMCFSYQASCQGANGFVLLPRIFLNCNVARILLIGHVKQVFLVCMTGAALSVLGHMTPAVRKGISQIILHGRCMASIVCQYPHILLYFTWSGLGALGHTTKCLFMLAARTMYMLLLCRGHIKGLLIKDSLPLGLETSHIYGHTSANPAKWWLNSACRS